MLTAAAFRLRHVLYEAGTLAAELQCSIDVIPSSVITKTPHPKKKIHPNMLWFYFGGRFYVKGARCLV